MMNREAARRSTKRSHTDTLYGSVAKRQYSATRTQSYSKVNVAWQQKKVTTGVRTADGSAMKRQYSATRTQSFKKVAWKRRKLTTGVRIAAGSATNPVLYAATRRQSSSNVVLEQRVRTAGGPAAKLLYSASTKQSSSKVVLEHGNVKSGARTDVLSILASSGRNLYGKERSVNKSQSVKETHGNNMLSLFAGSDRSLYGNERNMNKSQSVKKSYGNMSTSAKFHGWVKGKFLGEGGFAKVFKCVLPGNKPAAVKIVEMGFPQDKAQKDKKALENEIAILKELKHERIVSYYGSEQNDSQLHLFMEFMAGGSLSDYIRKNGVLSESTSKRYTKQMLEGVAFLHRNIITHRDIKGSNVLLDGKGNVKLADFGLSKIIQKTGSKTSLFSYCGTRHWMAPEIFRGEGYGRKADIWSIGCTVVEMLTGNPPFANCEPEVIFRVGSKPLEPRLPVGVSPDAKKFILAALRWKPDKRPSSSELQRYTFVSNRNPHYSPSTPEVIYPIWSLQ